MLDSIQPRPVPGTDQGKSYIAVPMIGKDRVYGIIGVEDFEHENLDKENAFSDSDVNLLTTLANRNERSIRKCKTI